MSKTKGNVIDPIEIVKRYGTDAVRFTLATMASPGTDIAFSEARTEGYRAFANKIWNAARFLFMQRERVFANCGGCWSRLILPLSTATMRSARRIANPDAPNRGPVDATKTAGSCRGYTPPRKQSTTALEAYRFDRSCPRDLPVLLGRSLRLVYRIGKTAHRYPKTEQDRTLSFLLFNAVFESALRMLSPFMPFITEEIWHAFYDGHRPSRSIALMPYPVSRRRSHHEGCNPLMDAASVPHRLCPLSPKRRRRTRA